jgi:hypothetical protein
MIGCVVPGSIGFGSIGFGSIVALTDVCEIQRRNMRYSKNWHVWKDHVRVGARTPG